MSDIAAAWTTIKDWAAEVTPGLVDSLLPGASEKEIAAFESRMQVRLPAGLREYLAIHNGQLSRVPGAKLNAPRLIWHRDHYKLLTLDEIVEARNDWDALADDFAGDPNAPEWRAGMLPLAVAGSGDLLTVELTPGVPETDGRVGLVSHDETGRELKDVSFGQWLTGFANELKRDRWSCDSNGWLEPNWPSDEKLSAEFAKIAGPLAAKHPSWSRRKLARRVAKIWGETGTVSGSMLEDWNGISYLMSMLPDE